MNILFLLAGIVIVFYALIPGLGAVHVRNQWRRFRATIRNSADLAPLRYRDLHGAGAKGDGRFRFLGYLEAIQDDTVWIRNTNLSVSAHLKEGDIYLLSDLQEGEKAEEEMLAQEPPKRIQWKAISAIPEGTKVLVFGTLQRSGGMPVFRGTVSDPVTMIIYEGEERSILKGSIWTGRHKNELLNQFTVPSAAAGSFALFFLAYMMFRDPMSRFTVLLSGTASLLPVMLFLPPGVVLLFLYRHFWKRGRIFRAERDLFLLPLLPLDAERPEGGERVILSDGEPYGVEKADSLEEVRAWCAEGYRIRGTGLVTVEDTSLYVFGVPEASDSGKIQFRAPADPLAEFLIVPGNPHDLSSACRKKARICELSAAACFLAGVIINAFLVFIVLGQIIR